MYEHLMRLVQIFGAANPDIHKIIAHYGGADKACEAIDSGDFQFPNDKLKKDAEYVTADKIRKVIDWCEVREIKLMSIYDKDYPTMLKEIFNPPVLLFYRGSPECLKKRCIAAVGAREITPYIEKLAARVSADLSKNNITIVSGMAHGVDSTALYACVNSGNPSAGVLACGIAYDYPRGSEVLRQRIIDNGGIYLSELMPTVKPTPEYFRARNRIMAGLSCGTIIFQASEYSGSLITANHSVQEGRDVFCVPPPNIFDSRYSGVVGLLRDGAIPLFNHDDVLNFYRNNY
ncbi:MAG: DNA-protecting protein DprA [Ruminiclostridium sp.]|nr:DNA-protecting protein DprA [Ruminiclostridium sp.]